MEKQITIVGAGIAGLSAGCYAALNGYKPTIFEMHSIPGGLCTAWERKEYRFDISMHMLFGSDSGPFHQMWDELGIIDRFEFHGHQDFFTVEMMGRSLQITTDRKQTEAALLKAAPEDAKMIRKFIRLIFGPDMMDAASLKPASLQTYRDKLRSFSKILPIIGTLIREGNSTILEYTQKFRNPFLRQVTGFFDNAPGWPMHGFPAVAMAGFINSSLKKARVPLGGSQKVINQMARLYRERGGTLHLNSRVKDLVVENERVAGIILADGSRHMSDTTIWAADGHTLIFDLLKQRYMDQRIKTMYENWQAVTPILHVMIGVDMDLSKEPHRIILEPSQPISIADRDHNLLMVLHHCFDPSMAPEGKSAVEVWYDTDYDYWENLSSDKAAYKAEKKRIADYTIHQLDRRWPGFESKVEVVDVPTPVTYNRYTGNWKGSPDGWYINPGNMMTQEPVRTLPGLEGLWMAGQWTAPFTGTVMASLSGRQIIQLMCHEDGRQFRSR